MAAEKLEHNEGQYALALQCADYRRAAWFCIRAMRRGGRMEPWKTRLRGCLERRFS